MILREKIKGNLIPNTGKYKLIENENKYLDEKHYIFKNSPYKYGEHIILSGKRYKVKAIRLIICECSEFIYELKEMS